MLNILSTMFDTTESMAENMTALGVLAVYLFIFGSALLYLFVLWIFKAIAVFKMSKTLNLSLPWIVFVPYALPFAYGRIAEHYNKNFFKKPIKFSILLLILQFLPDIVATILVILFIPIFVVSALINSEAIMIIGFLFAYFVMFVVLIVITLAINFFNILACWNVFGIFGGEKSIILFLISVTLGIEPFILFALRNKEPQNLKEKIIPETVEALEKN